jgi:hypothetical protein
MSDSSEKNLFVMKNQNANVNESRGTSRKRIFEDKKTSPSPNTKTISPNPNNTLIKNINLDNDKTKINSNLTGSSVINPIKNSKNSEVGVIYSLNKDVHNDQSNKYDSLKVNYNFAK